MPLSAILSQYSAILPIVAFLLFIRKIKDWQLWVILFYCVYSFANDTVMIYRATHDLRNIPELFHCYTIIEYLIFGVYLLSVLHSSAVKKLLVFVSVLFIAFCLYILTQERLGKFDSVQASVSAIILIAFCIIYLFEQINKPEPTFIYSSYTFWIITAILIYLAATLFLYGFASSLPTDVAQDYWVISQISNVLKNILISVAIIIYSKSSKTPKAPPPVGTDYQPYLN